MDRHDGVALLVIGSGAAWAVGLTAVGMALARGPDAEPPRPDATVRYETATVRYETPTVRMRYTPRSAGGGPMTRAVEIRVSPEKRLRVYVRPEEPGPDRPGG